MEHISEAIAAARVYLEAHPDEARYTDTEARAVLEEDLRFRVTGPGEESVTTDMSTAVGGGGEHPSPGWLFRAALASCNGTLIAMRAAEEGIRLTELEVLVDSESDDRGIFGMDPQTPAAPLGIRVRVRVAAEGVDDARLREVVRWGVDHCPVCDAAKRPVEVTTEIDTSA
ncbi:MAG TPA: OsmC family protein [Actinomycetota bacterium]|nr:OsmC family protein [Actinomycetota bacterium]